MKGKGFDQLRRAAMMGVVGMGGLGGGTARAATATIPLSHSVTSAARTFGFSQVGNVTGSHQLATATSVTTTIAFGIQDGAIYVPTASGVSSQNDWVDAAFEVSVDGVSFLNPDGDVDLTGDVLTSDTVAINGVDVTIQYTFGIGRPGVVRALYTFTNNSASSVTKSIAVGGNVGSDGNSTAQWSSDGDATIEATDSWYISSDNTTVGGDTASDPLFTLARFGAGARVTPTASSIPGTTDSFGDMDNFIENFAVTIPAGATRRILVFGEMNSTLTEAKANAASFSSKAAMESAGLLDGLTAAQRGEIVNYDLVGGGGGGGGGGAMPAGALALFGLAGLLRRRKADKA